MHQADFYLTHLGKLTKVVARANVTLRWLLLHSTPSSDAVESKRVRQAREVSKVMVSLVALLVMRMQMMIRVRTVSLVF